jgi:hypothetical protein
MSIFFLDRFYLIITLQKGCMGVNFIKKDSSCLHLDADFVEKATKALAATYPIEDNFFEGKNYIF